MKAGARGGEDQRRRPPGRVGDGSSRVGEGRPRAPRHAARRPATARSWPAPLWRHRRQVWIYRGDIVPERQLPRAGRGDDEGAWPC
jgi:hypothetical protein